MSEAADGSRSGRLRTEGIFRRALGERQQAPDEADRLPFGGRTEPTLDEPDAPAVAEQLPPPEPPLPEPAARSPSNHLRWTLASALTLLLSVGIGLALLVAPGGPLNVNDSPAMRRLLPSWAVDSLQAIEDRVSTSPRTNLPIPTEPVPEPAPEPASQSAAVTPEAPRTSTAGPEASASPNAAQVKPFNNLPAPDNTGSALTQGTEPGSTGVPPAATASAQQTSASTAKPPAADKARPAVRADAAQPARPPAARAGKATMRTAQDVEKSVRTASPASIFVQHASLASESDARAWRARHAALSRSKIVPLATPGKGIRYAVVSGPFANRKAAEAFVARKGVPPRPWLRTQASLQSALPARR